jgi:hypothetical protein
MSGQHVGPMAQYSQRERTELIARVAKLRAKLAAALLKLDACNPTIGLDKTIDGMLARQETLLRDADAKFKAAQGRRPMDTAPDNNHILLLHDGSWLEGIMEDGEWCSSVMPGQRLNPSAWAPLPGEVPS